MSKRRVKTKQLDDERKHLEEELEALRVQNEALEKQLEDRNVCEELFSKWSGIQVTRSDLTTCNVSFSITHCERTLGEFSIGFRKTGEYWLVDFHSLPPSVKTIKERVKKIKMKSLARLCPLLHEFQHEVQMFVSRGEQFTKAKGFCPAQIQIHPSVSTTSCLMEVQLCDNFRKSDLSIASIYLKYRSHKFLPERPHFKFLQGDLAAEAALKNQLSCLESMPLQDALAHAFNLNNPKADTDSSEFTSEVSDQLIGKLGSGSLSDTKKSEDVKTNPVVIQKCGSQDDKKMPLKGTKGGGRGRGKRRGRGRGIR